MILDDIEKDKIYIHRRAHNQPDQLVKAVYKTGDEVLMLYISDDCSKGMTMYFNRIECDGYIIKLDL